MSADHKQQEPVAWMNSKRDMSYLYGPYHDDDIPLYTSPPAQRTWVGLTDEEEVELWESTDSDWELMKRTEAKLKEKNT